MAEDSDLEKTEPASPRRLEKAREEGQVARSRELGTFLALLGGIAGLWFGGQQFYTALTAILRRGLGFDAVILQSRASLLEPASLSAWQALQALLPIFGVLVLAALSASIALGGGVWSLQVMAPKPERLSPLKGLKRMLGMQTWVELGKTLAKAALLTLVGIQVISMFLDDMLALSGMAPNLAVSRAMALVATCCAWIAASLLLVVLIDVPWQLWHHAKQLRMSREDVRQEHKESEGDPQLKSQIRQRQRAMAFNRMMSAVPKADVIVTNPTHYAAALQYTEGNGAAPRVVAKGRGALAARIRAIGQAHGIPQLQAPPLARALYHAVPLDQEIPAALYQAVAEVLAWVYQVRRWRQGRGHLPAAPGALAVPPGLDPHARRAGGTP